MAIITFDSADALSAAAKNLTAGQRDQVRAYLVGDGFEVQAPDDVIAALGAPPSAEVLKAYAADKRWQIETGGISVAGAAIQTDRASQAMITGAFAYAQANPSASIAYKTEGGFVMLSAAEIEAIANAVGAHVQACFAAEAAIVAAIEAGAITSFAAIDGADWPA